jgi:hypothetical protein
MLYKNYGFAIGDRVQVTDSFKSIVGEISDIFAVPREGMRYWVRPDGANYSDGYACETVLGGVNRPESSISMVKLSSLEFAL